MQDWYKSHAGQMSHTQRPNAVCLDSGVCVPTALPSSAAQLSDTVAPSASPALLAASKIKEDPDFFQGNGALHFAAGWALCCPCCHGEPNGHSLYV